MIYSELGTFLLIAIFSMAISMVIVPLMMRFAPVLGMIDKPDPRKVHAIPIPRVGGVGIVLGALIPMLIWLPDTALNNSFIFGCVVLLIFGVWDDVKELGHYVKFLGQFIAVISVVYYGGLYVEHFPYMGLESIPEYIGKPFTVIAIVGVINALNHSDGLDGLAGGESLLSLGAIIFLAYVYGGENIMIVACAVMGGIFGFLRFNSHPARVFMGDGGSQFIGFVLGVLVVILTQQVNPVLSPALPLLLIGLPIVDILAVFYLRGKAGVNLFKATSNHVHHRLLGLGFYHYESVMVIYSIQAFFVICAIVIPYEDDYLITAIYLLTCAFLFATLTIAERRDLRAHRDRPSDNGIDRLPAYLRSKFILDIPGQVMEAGVIIFLIASALMSEMVPTDIGVAALLMMFILLLMLKWKNVLVVKLIAFVAIGFAVYLLTNNQPEWLIDKKYLVYVYFTVLTVATFIVARMMSGGKFQITPLDYLLVIIALIIGIAPQSSVENSNFTWMALQMIVLFYACELIIQRMLDVRSRFTGALLTMLTLVAVRGLM